MAPSFRDRSFSSRFKAMGDEAEGVFEAVYPHGFARYGINRPPINLARVPALIRYTPDYLTARGLVEVQGFGADQTFKLKLDKLNALLDWRDATAWSVELFVWDSANGRWAWLDLDAFVKDLTKLAERRMFAEGKEYWAAHADVLPTKDGWHPFDPEAVD